VAFSGVVILMCYFNKVWIKCRFVNRPKLIKEKEKDEKEKESARWLLSFFSLRSLMVIFDCVITSSRFQGACDLVSLFCHFCEFRDFDRVVNTSSGLQGARAGRETVAHVGAADAVACYHCVISLCLSIVIILTIVTMIIFVAFHHLLLDVRLLLTLVQQTRLPVITVLFSVSLSMVIILTLL
jgi:hypothetical protein